MTIFWWPMVACTAVAVLVQAARREWYSAGFFTVAFAGIVCKAVSNTQTIDLGTRDITDILFWAFLSTMFYLNWRTHQKIREKMEQLQQQLEMFSANRLPSSGNVPERQ